MTELESPDWSGQIRVPWVQCGLLTGVLHPMGAIRLLPLEPWRDTWIGTLIEAGQFHPIACFGAIWMALAGIAPWKSLRSDLTNTALSQ